MKLYLSGPMSGYRNLNRDMHRLVKEWLEKKKGHEVVSPALMDSVDGGPPTPRGKVGDRWIAFIMRDISMILTMDLDGIVMMKGWEKSKGSRMELLAALCRGLKVFDEEMREMKLESIPVEDLK